MDLNQDLVERDHEHLIHSLHNPAVHRAGVVWTGAEGIHLRDAAGRSFIDGMSGLWNVTLGHGRRELIDAASRQLATLAYCSGYTGTSNLPALEFAERLARLTYPSINRFFLTSGGAESTDSSIKLARYYWKAVGRPGKVKTISLIGGYHGVTLGAMCATGMPGYWAAFEPRMPGFVHIPNHDRYRYEPAAGADPATAAADELEAAILREGPETVALFLIEPVLGAGAYVPPDGYFRRIREICDRHDVLFAADEVITGFGRTGRLFALDHWGVEPDLVQFAKGVTSGYVPMGGVGVSDRISRVLDAEGSPPWMHCFTYSGHPVACAVALAVLDVLDKEDLPARAAILGQRLRDGLTREIGQHPHVGEIRGLGLLDAVEFVQDRETKAPFPAGANVLGKILAACRERGLITRGRGDTLYIGPPLTSTEAEIDQVVGILADAVRATDFA